MSDDATTTEDDEGRLVERVPLRDGQAHGLAERFAPDGTRVRTAAFRHGRLDGELVEDDPATGRRLRYTFADGVLEGPSTIEQDGRPLLRMGFAGGALDGPFETFDPASGKTLYSAVYARGLLDGPAALHGPDGALLRESTYAAGLLHGEVVDYAPDGSVRQRQRYRAGVPEAEAADSAASECEGEEEPWFRRWARRPEQRSR